MAHHKKKSLLAKAFRKVGLSGATAGTPDIAAAFDLRSKKYWAGVAVGVIAAFVWKGIRR